MTTFRRILSLPCATYCFTSTGFSRFCTKLGAHPRNNFSRLCLTQSRCVSTNKFIKDVESETESKRHSLFRINYATKNKNESSKQLEDSTHQKADVNLSDLIESIQQSPVLDERFIRNHLKTMIQIYKTQKYSANFAQEMNSYVKSKEFEILTVTLDAMLPMVSTNYLSLVFEAMHLYGIPTTSILMQKLHALVLDNINSFDLTDILQMYLLIKNENEKSLELLNDAFLKFMEHVTLDDLNFMMNIKRLIYFVDNEEVPFSVREKILRRALILGPDLKFLSPAMLTKLSFPLFSPEFRHFEKELYLKVLEETIPNFPYYCLKSILLNLVHGIRKQVIFYDSKLFDCVALGAAKCWLSNASYISTLLLGTGHLNYKLVDHIADELLVCDLETLNSNTMETIIYSFGEADYKNYTLREQKTNWNKLESLLKNYIQPGVTFKAVRTVLSLLALEIDTSKIISPTLNDFWQQIDNASRITLTRATLAYQFYRWVHKKPPENVPENFLPACLTRIRQTWSYNWEEAVNESFKKENVLKNCISPRGTIFTYVVVLGPDRTPINLSAYQKPNKGNSDSSEFIEVEKIERPPGSTVLAFIEYGTLPVRFRNTSDLRLETRMVSSMHRALGYKTFHFFMKKGEVELGDQVYVIKTFVQRANREEVL